jgi:hypothetical protein
MFIRLEPVLTAALEEEALERVAEGRRDSNVSL